MCRYYVIKWIKCKNRLIFLSYNIFRVFQKTDRNFFGEISKYRNIVFMIPNPDLTFSITTAPSSVENTVFSTYFSQKSQNTVLNIFISPPPINATRLSPSSHRLTHHLICLTDLWMSFTFILIKPINNFY